MATVFSARASGCLAKADAYIEQPNYKKPLVGVGAIATADVVCTDTNVKTNISASGAIAQSDPSAIPAIKVPVGAKAAIANASVIAYPNAKVPTGATGAIALADVSAMPSKKTPISSIIPIAWADAHGLIASSHSVSATGTIAKSDAVLTKAYRKVEPPPPTFDVLVQSPTGEVPLQGYTMYYGSSYRLNLRMRGYFLSHLGEQSGPEIRFSARLWTGAQYPIFTKSTHQPVGGIGITKVATIAENEQFGVLEEAIAQIRIYPEDTTLQERRRQQIFYEIAYIDPLAERPEPHTGSFSISI
jgi:hypothetical protein